MFKKLKRIISYIEEALSYYNSQRTGQDVKEWSSPFLSPDACHYTVKRQRIDMSVQYIITIDSFWSKYSEEEFDERIIKLLHGHIVEDNEDDSVISRTFKIDLKGTGPKIHLQVLGEIDKIKKIHNILANMIHKFVEKYDG